MSRSYKKNPVIKETGKGKKFQKKTANHKLRRKLNKIENEDVGNNANYKKHYEQWNICDFKSTWTEEEALAWFRETKDPNSIKYDPHDKTTEKDFLRWWRTKYKNK